MAVVIETSSNKSFFSWCLPLIWPVLAVEGCCRTKFKPVTKCNCIPIHIVIHSVYMDMYMAMCQSSYSLYIFDLLSKQHMLHTLLRHISLGCGVSWCFSFIYEKRVVCIERSLTLTLCCTEWWVLHIPDQAFFVHEKDHEFAF
jgi:hypothetical protein